MVTVIMLAKNLKKSPKPWTCFQILYMVINVMTHAMSLDLHLFFTFPLPSLLCPSSLPAPLKGYSSVALSL